MQNQVPGQVAVWSSLNGLYSNKKPKRKQRKNGESKRQELDLDGIRLSDCSDESED